MFGKNQRKVISILKCNDTKGKNIKQLGAMLNLPDSEVKKIIKPLEHRNLVKNNKVELFFRDEKSNMNMSKARTRVDFYQEIKTSKIFKNTTEGIEIKANVDFYKIFHKSISENISLHNLKTLRPNNYKRLVTGFVNNLHFQIEELKRKIYSWSNGIYKIIIENVNSVIKMVNTNSGLVVVLHSNYKKNFSTDHKVLSECVFLLKKTLKELSDSAISLGTSDYSKF